jgi:hypothetical protein
MDFHPVPDHGCTRPLPRLRRRAPGNRQFRPPTLPPGTPLSTYREHFQRTITLNTLKDRSMTTSFSRLPLTLAATHSGAGKEGFAHIWRDEFQARIPPLILDLSVNISRLVSLLEGSSSDPAQKLRGPGRPRVDPSVPGRRYSHHHRAVGNTTPPCCGVPESGPFWKPGPLVPPGPADCPDQGSS